MPSAGIASRECIYDVMIMKVKVQRSAGILYSANDKKYTY